LGIDAFVKGLEVENRAPSAGAVVAVDAVSGEVEPGGKVVGPGAVRVPEAECLDEGVLAAADAVKLGEVAVPAERNRPLVRTLLRPAPGLDVVDFDLADVGEAAGLEGLSCRVVLY
jgi:hypothetical protein